MRTDLHFMLNLVFTSSLLENFWLMRVKDHQRECGVYTFGVLVFYPWSGSKMF